MNIRHFISTVAFMLVQIAPFWAQHPHSAPMSKDTAMPMTHDKMAGDTEMSMSSVFSKNLPMAVNGSGTTWHPVNSPMYMQMWHGGKWHFMLHYGAFFRYSAQNVGRENGERGSYAFDVPNWVMLMTTRHIGKNGLLMLRGMFSADPLTVGGEGYPLLFQTGESWKDSPLIDHQHPHDLFSELSIGYTQAFNQHTDLYVYFGMPGEPSIGPPAFMHRPSALNMPSAPLSHHWQDAAHITFGVATLGFRYRNAKLEGSLFTGREPGENRYDFDKPRFDSYSTRFSFSPARSLALQVSYGWLESPEALEPEKDVERITASALHSVNLDEDLILSSTLVWGLNRNHHPGESVASSHSVLLESDFQMKKHALFTRVEWIQKDNEDLNLSDGFEGLHNHSISGFTLGASRYLWKSKYFWMDLGLTGTVYGISNELEQYYGRNPYSAEIFLRIIPPRMNMKMNDQKNAMPHKM
ncbi:MAG: hypothetical protein JNM22_22045 [Saprospiraceae bacterium]|nr:hypothetical protein [Saprospiraceae bacterium]